YEVIEKVVVVKSGAKLFKELKDYPGMGKECKVFSIYPRIKRAPDDPKELTHVADFKGQPVGYIKTDYLHDWDTRFALEPVQPQSGFRFSFTAAIECKQKEIHVE